MSKHTPEPWKTVGFWIYSKNRESIGYVISRGCGWTRSWGMNNRTKKEARANNVRIVACVNACAGMEDPATEIKAMREEVEQLRERNQELANRLRIENDAQGYEITKLREDKARLVEALKMTNEHVDWVNIIRDNKQLLTEMEGK